MYLMIDGYLCNDVLFLMVFFLSYLFIFVMREEMLNLKYVKFVISLNYILLGFFFYEILILI